MNIIVTGASRGIGFEVVKKFAELGDNRIIALARSKEKLNQLSSLCNNKDNGIAVYPIDYDLTNDDLSDLLTEIKTKINSVDILINNAGFLLPENFKEFKQENARKIFDVNFFAPAKLIQVLIPHMNKNSHIINVSSMGGFQGSQKFPGLSYYSASKAAIASLSECLALELKEDKIFVNSLALGAVQTEMLAEAFPGFKAPLIPEEMADFIVDFAINGHKYYNGKILPVSVSTP